MNIMKIKKARFRTAIRFTLIVSLAFLSIRCQNDVIEWEPSSDQMVITDYVYSEPEMFSEFGEALQLTGIENLLRVRGPYTLLLPVNSAMEEYYSRRGVSSCSEIPVEELEDLVYNHILQGEVGTGGIGPGKLIYQNGLNDFVASDLPGSDILLNKTATIIKRDITAANGVVHHLDYVLEPITEGVYDILSSYEGYSIFLQGLEKAGLVDTLNVISFPYGQITARTRYTLLAVPDTLFNRMGIHSVDDLINAYSDSEDLTDMNNGFYKYMEYHCLSGTHYFSDFAPEDIYYLISYENYLSIVVEEDFKVNKTDTGYTAFYYDLSNIPAKNGAIHTISTLLENTETGLAEIIFQTTDYFDLHQGSYYINQYYQRFYDGENTFEFIKWDAEYLMYYYKIDHHLMDDDALNLNGHFWIEITTPKIRKGKYTLSTFMFFGGNSVTAWYIDGEYLGQFDLSEYGWGPPAEEVGEVDFQETKQHTIRLQTIVPGGIFWDYVQFTPL